MSRYAGGVEPFLDPPRPVARERRGRGRPTKYLGRWFGNLLRDIAEIAKANPTLSDRSIARIITGVSFTSPNVSYAGTSRRRCNS